MDAGTGSLVQVPFHGRRVRGWVLGPTDDVPDRMLPVRGVSSEVRFFDTGMLELFRWVADRYIAPLATVIGRSHPPRTVSEEAVPARGAPDRGTSEPPHVLAAGYRGGARIVEATAGGSGAFVLRPAPEDEAQATVELVAACLAGGRRAIVLVPEARPIPATARALADAFGSRALVHLGGDRRTRYRSWLDARAGAYDLVVGTRTSVFAPLEDLGLIVVSRESHAAHREDRAPYLHVRDVAIERARRAGAACVLSALCPSSEAAGLRLSTVTPLARRWPPVEVVRPGPEGRAPRLVRALREATRGFLFAPVPGYGVARVCRRCGVPAACASCGGLLRAQEGSIRCVVCESVGRCAACGADDFGIQRGGAERVEEWAGAVASVPVRRIERPRAPKAREIVVGGPESIRELGTLDLDLVGILDADLAGRRPGIGAHERALTMWMEAVGWARPHGAAIVQASQPNDPAVQALVRGNPDRFHRREAERRRQAGFPVGAAVFRVVGTSDLDPSLAGVPAHTALTTTVEGQRVWLLSLDAADVAAFGTLVRALAAKGVVTRVEAEPHL